VIREPGGNGKAF